MRGFLLALLWLVGGAGAQASGPSIVLQSTTSTANSGLYDHILPLFREATGITVHVVAVGTGQAIRNAGNCDGDVLLVHSRADEEAFVADGRGVARADLMYNDFVVVGPVADPAGLAEAASVTDAFRRLAEAGALFTSRGDASGTHRKEQALWSEAGIDPSAASGQWYREVGAGMGATLNTTIGMGAYTLTDRATWISFANKQDFRVLVEGASALLNQYGVILVNPNRCRNVNAEAGQTFIDWLLSDAGQGAIAGFEVAGEPLFFPNAQTFR